MRQEERLGRRFNTRRLEDPVVKRSFVEELETRAAGIHEGGSVEELRIRRKEWITDDTKRKVEEQRDAKVAIERARTRVAKRQARQQYSALSKEVKRSCRWDKRVWVDFLAEEVLTVDQSSTSRHEPLRVRRISRVSSEVPSLPEIKAAIQSMKSNKGPGVDRISAKMLKADLSLYAQMLHQLFRNIWDTTTFPVDWKQGVLVRVPKKGDSTECDNRRAEDRCDLPTTAGRTDRLNHENLWGALRRKGIPDKIVNLIEAQYEAFACKVLHNGALSDSIRVVSGVMKRCILSPPLFLIVIDEIMVGAIGRVSNRGLLWQPITMEHLNDVDLADDVVLVSQQRSDMQSKLNDLVKRSSAVGLNINVSKTKSLDVNAANPSNFTVAGQVVDEVESFQYLGSQIASDGGTKSDKGARIKKARSAFACL
ncbi:uncharacterized protein LOC131428765 [Malaya genurostris]|uniref:uncharacterized protein LOC131428765 n=1 Tax=Malaya genurostris TaxID=325434 RepID=UPI0026F3CBB0|nr:uncharacterized protein LOC131428765 [Malaya genurostris]